MGKHSLLLTIVLGLLLIGIATIPAAAANISGTVQASENNKVLSNVVMELRDQVGTVQSQQTTTGPSPNYTFTGVAAGNYFVDPVLARNQYPKSALYQPVAAGGTANFTIGGTSVTLHIQGAGTPAGTFVLITPSAQWTSAVSAAPLVDQNSQVITNVYSRTVDHDGKATISVAPNYQYFIACWKPSGTGPNTTYAFTTNATAIPGGSGGGGALEPMDTIATINCP